MKKLRIIFLGLCALSAVQDIGASESSVFPSLYNQLPSWQAISGMPASALSWMKNNRVLATLIGTAIMAIGTHSYTAGFIPRTRPYEDKMLDANKSMKAIWIEFLIDFAKNPTSSEIVNSKRYNDFKYYRDQLGLLTNPLFTDFDFKSLSKFLYLVGKNEKEEFFSSIEIFAKDPFYSFMDFLAEIKNSEVYKFCTNKSFKGAQARAIARFKYNNESSSERKNKKQLARDIWMIIEHPARAAFENDQALFVKAVNDALNNNKLTIEFMLSCTEEAMEDKIKDLIDKYQENKNKADSDE